MSYDISIRSQKCPTCNHVKYCGDWNPTYNFGPMFAEAGLTREALDGKRCGDVVALFRAGLDAMIVEPERFVKHNAPNGWGVYGDGILEVLKAILAAMEAYPDGVVEWR